MRILCLIYSIQDPLPASHQPRAPSTSPTSTTSTSLSSRAFPSATSVASTITSHEPPGTQNGSSFIPSQRTLESASPSEESHTPNADQRTPGRNNDWEMVDSDWERPGSDRENARIREREQFLRESATERLRETSFDVNEAIGNVMLRGAALQPPQQQPPTRPTIRKSASNTSITSRQEARTPLAPTSRHRTRNHQYLFRVYGRRCYHHPDHHLAHPYRPDQGALVPPRLSPLRFSISRSVKWVYSHGAKVFDTNIY
jgi:hypothetical protein